jgi:Fic family protein
LNKTQNTWKTEKEDITPWLLFFLDIVKTQSTQALKIIEGDNIEYLLSGKQLELWQWANNLGAEPFSRKDAIKALNFSPRTVDSIIKKLLNLHRLEKQEQGRAVQYRVLTK